MGRCRAARKQVLTVAVVSEAARQPAPYVIWDARLTGFGLRVSPGGAKSFFVQYRSGEGRRSDANRKVTLGRFPLLSPAEARKQALTRLGAARSAREASPEPARMCALPRLGEAVEEWLQARSGLGERSRARYRSVVAVMLRGWSARRVDEVTREEVARRFAEVTERHGWTQANKGMKLLGAVYRRCAADHPSLRDPVALWAAAGGRLHPPKRRRIETPAEVLPAWARGIERAVRHAATRELFWTGLYTGMRLEEARSLRWECVDLVAGTLLVERTKNGDPLLLPLSRQLAALLLRRRSAHEESGSGATSGWVFVSARKRHAPVAGIDSGLYRSIERHGGKPFWFHAMRNCFISIASHDLLLPESLVKRLVNHRPPAGDVTQGYAADWTLEQLRGPAQRIADRIDALVAAGSEQLDDAERDRRIRDHDAKSDLVDIGAGSEVAETR